MAKKMKAGLFSKYEAENQGVKNEISPEEIRIMSAFEDEFEQLPEAMKGKMFELVRRFIAMSEKERVELLDTFEKLEEYFGDDELDFVDDALDDDLNDDFDGDLDDEPNDDDEVFGDFDDLDALDDYPHFLPSNNVLKYTLRVTLRGHKPSIYRKFCVPSNISLRHLSELLIELMGWEGYHLNQFRRGSDLFAPAHQRDGGMSFGGVREHDQEEYSIGDILVDKGKTIEWEYDFGDSWLHDVRLSSVEEYAENEPLVSFVKGECACPPEDCGGIWGYEELLEIYSRYQKYTKGSGKRPSAEQMERLEWYGMDEYFYPNDYDIVMAREICESFGETQDYK